MEHSVRKAQGAGSRTSRNEVQGNCVKLCGCEEYLFLNKSGLYMGLLFNEGIISWHYR